MRLLNHSAVPPAFNDDLEAGQALQVVWLRLARRKPPFGWAAGDGDFDVSARWPRE